MRTREITLDLGHEALAALDFGGTGVPVLLVHGSGHNAAVWTGVAAHLIDHCRVVAVDLRGHGHTRVDSHHAEQYWRDLAGAVQALGWENPVLVGHSLGGYAVTAVAAGGLVRPAAVCVVDGLVLNTREKAVEDQAQWTTPEAKERLRAQFGYGWSSTPEQAREYIERSVREAPQDHFNRGCRPDLVRGMLERSFTKEEHTWLRRPTPEQIAVISSPAPDAAVYPSVDVMNTLPVPSRPSFPTKASTPRAETTYRPSSPHARNGHSWRCEHTTMCP